MSVIDNRYETSDIKTRKRHEVVLTVNSPNSSNKEMELSVCHVVHVSPSEKALEAKAQKLKQKEQELLRQLAEQANEAVQVADTVEETVNANEVATAEDVASAPVVSTAEESAPAAEPVAIKNVGAIDANEQMIQEPVANQAFDVIEPEVNEEPVFEQVYAAQTAGSTYEPKCEEKKVAKEVTDYSEDIYYGKGQNGGEVARKRSFRLSLTQKKALSGWIFVLPFVLGVLFIYAPIIYDSIVISMSDVKLVPGGMELTWNNFANYSYLFAEDGDEWFSITIVDGITDLLLQIPAIVIFALFMAIILNQKMTGRAVFRAIFFLPVILSTGIIDSIDSNSAFMEAIANSQGGVDDNTGAAEAGGIISAMDLEQLLGGIKIGTELVDYVVGLVNGIFDIVSRSGVQMLIFLSGLQSISPAIYESCEVEGASAWETFWKITLPMISPMILVNAIYTVIDAFTAADNRVMVYIEQTYNKSKFAISSAMSWVYVGVVLLFIVLVALIMKAVVFYQKRD